MVELPAHPRGGAPQYRPVLRGAAVSGSTQLPESFLDAQERARRAALRRRAWGLAAALAVVLVVPLAVRYGVPEQAARGLVTASVQVVEEFAAPADVAEETSATKGGP